MTIDVKFIDSGRTATEKPNRETRQGNPCKRGHGGLRFLDRSCVECKRERAAGLHFRGDPAETVFEGVPCRHGHGTLRYRKGGRCVRCACKNADAQRLKDPIGTRKMGVVWRSNNREKLAADKAAYAKSDPERTRSYNRSAKARKRNAEGRHTSADIAEIRKIQRDTCFYCRDPLDGAGHADHFIALAKGGTNWPENICLACSPCNLSKGVKNPIEWAVEQELIGVVAIVSDSGVLLPARQWL